MATYELTFKAVHKNGEAIAEWHAKLDDSVTPAMLDLMVADLRGDLVDIGVPDGDFDINYTLPDALRIRMEPGNN